MMFEVLGGCLIGGACRAWVVKYTPVIKLVAVAIKLKLKGSHY